MEQGVGGWLGLPFGRAELEVLFDPRKRCGEALGSEWGAGQGGRAGDRPLGWHSAGLKLKLGGQTSHQETGKRAGFSDLEAPSSERSAETQMEQPET